MSLPFSRLCAGWAEEYLNHVGKIWLAAQTWQTPTGFISNLSWVKTSLVRVAGRFDLGRYICGESMCLITTLPPSGPCPLQLCNRPVRTIPTHSQEASLDMLLCNQARNLRIRDGRGSPFFCGAGRGKDKNLRGRGKKARKSTDPKN